MKILITGANSYTGARVFFDLKSKYETIGTYTHTQLSDEFLQVDLIDNDSVKRVIQKTAPDIIVHIAANANPRWCAAHPEEAYTINVEATKYLAESAAQTKTKFIYMSSVLALNPISVYNTSKREAEHIIQSVNDYGFLILRPSFILGYSPNLTNDRPFNRLMKNLDEHTPAVYDDTWKFQPTYIRHISEIVSACIEKNIWNTALPVAVQERKTRYETARDILTPFGVSVSKSDTKDTSESTFEDVAVLSSLHLPTYTYAQMITCITKEIKNRSQYTL